MPRWATGTIAVALLAGLIALAVVKINLNGLGSALVHVDIGWLVCACVLMAAAFLARGESWFVVIRSALPADGIRRPVVIRALFIGMAGSSVAPGRLGEAARVLVVSRHAADRAGSIAVLAGTVLAQTVLNLLALVVLAAVTLGAGAIPGARTGGILAALGLPLLLVVVALAASQAMVRAGNRAGGLPRPLAWLARQVVDARNGLRVFREPRDAAHAAATQFVAWAMQWACCYGVLLALGLSHRAGIAAAAVLLAVNVTAIVPLTPSNVGVFQAACIAVLAVFGVPTAHGLAYGLVLQAIEIVVAFALGLPSLVSEGVSVGQLRAFAAGGDRPPEP
ncbi:MAG TPA: lysylphosphatidylglycerol synthase transmembrane domain-containing protein [Solirubrobacteraceae bacterium]